MTKVLTHSTDLDLRYTLAHLARLDLLVRREVLRLRKTDPDEGDDEFRGLYISPEQIDALLSNGSSGESSFPDQPSDDRDQALEASLRASESEIERLEKATGHPEYRLTRLGRLFGLSSLELSVVVVCLSSEIDLRYEKFFAFLNDDVTKKRPTVDLVLRLLCRTLQERLGARRVFEPDAPLLRWGLVTVHDDPGARSPVLLAKYLKLDDHVAGYLLGSGANDARLTRSRLLENLGGVASSPPPLLERVRDWARNWGDFAPANEPVVLFHGRYGTGRRAAAAALASALDRHCLFLDAGTLADGDAPCAHAVMLAEREARLFDLVLCWCNADGLADPPHERGRWVAEFLEGIARGSRATVILTQQPWDPATAFGRRPCLRLEFPDPGYGDRQTVWADGLMWGATTPGEADLRALAGRFRLTQGQIGDALSRAKTIAWARDPDAGTVCPGDIDEACRAASQHNLRTLARKLRPRYTWDEIVLPPAQRSTLQLICATVRQRARVYDEWGFDRKLAMGKGVIALFSGPSGTGKTMAAEVIAHDLGLDLYRIDLAAVVSKYIGETEKNLERIFREAQYSDAILFFDEADALFGKRSEVKDAHDRYANIETAYLLQRTEEYDGLAILSTNLQKNLDEAFLRRLHFAVDFPEPEEPERLRIWEQTFPAAVPREADLDLPSLARRLKITGGNIRNIVLGAAFLAAEENAAIGMRHLNRAVVHELRKMGRLVVEGEFLRHPGPAAD